MLDPIPAPEWAGQTLLYKTHSRAKRSFQTVLDAADLLVEDSPSRIETRLEGDQFVLKMVVRLKGGKLEDTITLGAVPGDSRRGLQMNRLERNVDTNDGTPSRRELVDFLSNTHALPPCTYVEVAAPFLLCGHPFDGKRRSLYAWICDRFVAKVYYESHKTAMLTVPAGTMEAREVIMYPDLNDWVNLPSIIAKMSKPFLPKYHMWYEAKRPHRLVKFEGPYGPPGAPEIVFEWMGTGE